MIKGDIKITEYAIIQQKNAISKVTGQPTTTITYVDLKSRKHYKGYVDQNNRNYQNWLDIVNYPAQGYIVTNVHPVLRNDQWVIDSDCEPVIILTHPSSQDLWVEIQSAWRQADKAKITYSSVGCKNNFNDLFE